MKRETLADQLDAAILCEERMSDRVRSTPLHPQPGRNQRDQERRSYQVEPEPSKGKAIPQCRICRRDHFTKQHPKQGRDNRWRQKPHPPPHVNQIATQSLPPRNQTYPYRPCMAAIAEFRGNTPGALPDYITCYYEIFMVGYLCVGEAWEIL